MTLLRLLVAVKRVIDYNARIRVNAAKTGIVTDGVRMSLNPFCEIAVEEAIRLKESAFADNVCVVSIGGDKVQDVLRTSLAMGADTAIHIAADDGLHPLKIAQILKALISKKDYNMVIMGKQAIDDDYNQTVHHQLSCFLIRDAINIKGQMLAGMLQWPQATFASKIEVLPQQEALQVQREVDGGLETIQVSLPAVVTTDLRLNEPRYATLPKIMKAKKEKIEKLTLTDLACDQHPSQVEIIEVNEPAKRARGVMVHSVEELVSKLRKERNLL